MLLKDTFYHVIDSRREDESHTVYRVALHADSHVYDGHFPGKPVTPGVCEIELTKELAMMQTGQSLLLTTVNLCRFKAVASPTVCPEVDVQLELQPTETGYKMLASVSAGETVYMEIKAELTTNSAR